MQAEETAHNRALEGLKLPGILSKYIQMFKDRDSIWRNFNKDHIESILLLCYETNPSISSKKGDILKYLEAKFDENTDKMVSHQTHALPDLPAKEADDSLIDPTEKEN